jgi:hypothetical protein
MAEFLLLFRGGNANAAGQSPEQMQAHMQKWVQWMDKLAKQGKMSGAQPLEPTGKTVSGRKKVVSDGPFAEGKELVGGYLVCKADTIEEAVEITKDCPLLEFEDGVVEVRAVRSMEMPSH